MAHYRKKPVVVEARQWLGTVVDATAIIDWILDNNGTARYHSPVEEAHRKFGPPSISINTLEGTITASPHDFIIKGVQGEFYPCKPNIFEQTYEEVEV